MANPRIRRTRRHQRHRETVMRSHNGVCHICGQGAADAIDHIVAVSWGGSDDPSNLAPAHTSCNTAKGDSAPPQWTYNYPSMWLSGYGPRAPQTPQKSGTGNKPGCFSYAFAVIAALLAGGLAGVIIPSEWVVLFVTVAVAWMLIRWLQRKAEGEPDPSDIGLIESAKDLFSSPGKRDEPTELTMADGTPIRDARGIPSLGGTAADIAPEGDEMVWLDFTIEGDNIETLISILQIGPAFTGYRDGLVQPDGDRLQVVAMARLAADVAASGDDRMDAAPIGFVAAGEWERYPGLGRDVTFVQVGITIARDGSRSAKIGFRRSVVL